MICRTGMNEALKDVGSTKNLSTGSGPLLNPASVRPEGDLRHDFFGETIGRELELKLKPQKPHHT